MRQSHRCCRIDVFSTHMHIHSPPHMPMYIERMFGHVYRYHSQPLWVCVSCFIGSPFFPPLRAYQVFRMTSSLSLCAVLLVDEILSYHLCPLWLSSLIVINFYLIRVQSMTSILWLERLCIFSIILQCDCTISNSDSD